MARLMSLKNTRANFVDVLDNGEAAWHASQGAERARRKTVAEDLTRYRAAAPCRAIQERASVPGSVTETGETCRYTTLRIGAGSRAGRELLVGQHADHDTVGIANKEATDTPGLVHGTVDHLVPGP